MEVLMDAYCRSNSIGRRDIRFLYNGRLIEPYHTAASLQLMDGDIFDALLQQKGD
jgi:hypothetical protein